MAATLKDFVKRDAPEGPQGRITTPNAQFQDRRARASANRVKVTKADLAKPSIQNLPGSNGFGTYKQEHSAQKFPAGFQNHTHMGQHEQLDVDEEEDGLFDNASVAREDFDKTLSSVEQNEEYERGYGIHGGRRAVYQQGAHGSSPAEVGHTQDPGEYDDDDEEEADEASDEEGDDDGGDDRTVHADEMMGIMQAGQQNSKWQGHRPNGPSHFASVSANGLASNQTSMGQQYVFKTPASIYTQPGQRQQYVNNGLSSPSAGYGSRRSYEPFPIQRQDEYGNGSDGLYSEQQDHESNLALPATGEREATPITPISTPVRPDYDEKLLYTMDYATLKAQPFDDQPGDTAPSQPPANGLPPAGASFKDRLKHMSKQGQLNQAEFFSQLSKEEWEKSGDWFIDQFTDLMKQMRAARQAKREISKQFEDEIAAREEAVRGKTVGIEQVLRKMKTGGETVLKQKI